MTKSTPFALTDYLAQCQQRSMTHLTTHLDRLPALPGRLLEAMRYSTLQGGKRIRPTLVYASAHAVSGALEPEEGMNPDLSINVAACAVELIHCYSLIHDDLPAMDNDDLRRGQPTVHRAFDEATAILAGDALQALAFRILSSTSMKPANAQVQLQMLNTLSQAAGYEGMVGGQTLDTDAAGKTLGVEAMETMHLLKTGALISASVQMGALSTCRAGTEQLSALSEYARCIGLAFQVQDDILDVTTETLVLGKTQGADQALNKPTYVSLLGLAGARQRATELYQEALTALEIFDARAEALRALAAYIVQRRS